MKSLEAIKKYGKHNKIDVNLILNFASDTIDEQDLLSELVYLVKKEYKQKIISEINHIMR